MMGKRTVMQEALFYSFSIEDHVPADHLLLDDRKAAVAGVVKFVFMIGFSAAELPRIPIDNHVKRLTTIITLRPPASVQTERDGEIAKIPPVEVLHACRHAKARTRSDARN